MSTDGNRQTKEMLENAMKATQTASFYDDVWANDERTLADMVIPGSFGEARVRFIQGALKRIRQQQEIDILDLGCGSGWLETFISSYGAVTAIDFSPAAIREANAKYREHATFLLADPTSPRLGIPESTSFDVVVASEVIEHVEHPIAFLNQISSLLRPLGWCILTTPNGNVWQKYVCDDRYRQHQQPVEKWLTPYQLATLVRNTGFRVIRHEGWSNQGFPYTAISRFFAHPLAKALLFTFGLSATWKRLMLSGGILQLLVAQKST